MEERRERPRAAITHCLVWLTLAVSQLTSCANISYPTDWLINLPIHERYDGLQARYAEATLVVLQHGMWRSSASLGRLQRSLESHGYEVLNTSYPSQSESIESHAERLGCALETHLRQREEPYARLCFVGHSMGGLVIRAYLAGQNVHKADTCVFIATPHRGATLADQNKDTLLFRTFMGDDAALQLCTTSQFFKRLKPLDCQAIGTIVGGAGDGAGYSANIPGDDDGIVGVTEAHLHEETNSIRIAQGHTRLTFSDESIRLVLQFLKHREF